MLAKPTSISALGHEPDVVSIPMTQLGRHGEGLAFLLLTMIPVLIVAMYAASTGHFTPAQIDDALMLDAGGVYEAGMPMPAP